MSFKKLFIIVVIFTNLIFAQNEKIKKERLAVSEISGSSLDKSVSNALSQVVTAVIVKQFNDKYELLERSQMNAILKEQGFQQSGACDDISCAIEMGNLLGVSKIVIGNVEKLGSTYILTLKLVDVESGKILNISAKKHRGAIDDLIDISKDATAELLNNNNNKVISDTKIIDSSNNQQIDNNSNEKKVTPVKKVEYKTENGKPIKNENKFLKNCCVGSIAVLLLLVIL